MDIAAGNEAVERYKSLAATWRHPAQLDALGGFGGLFALPGDERRALVASTDGVGTKVLIAAALGKYDGVGADLVNHCVNDILVTGARALFFLDYLAVGKLEPQVAAAIVSGVHRACRENDLALLGGETAEMPDVYDSAHFDLAGTIVGIVDRECIPNAQDVIPGDAILGLPAVGLHTNGYTLARQLIPQREWAERFEDTTYGEALLAPHPSYAAAVANIGTAATPKAMAHITGGGLMENVPRTLPSTVRAVFEQSRWIVPPLLREICRRGNLSQRERYRTLNMGIGYTLVVARDQARAALAAEPRAFVAGWIEARPEGEPPIVIHPARSEE